MFVNVLVEVLSDLLEIIRQKYAIFPPSLLFITEGYDAAFRTNRSCYRCGAWAWRVDCEGVRARRRARCCQLSCEQRWGGCRRRSEREGACERTASGGKR